MKKKVYAVRKGRKTGIFYSWKECETHVKGYSGAQYRSFPSKNLFKIFLIKSLHL
ncbi:RNase H1/viroplasmin domain-containing protein, partial [Bacillus thuringiensis]